MPVRSKRRVPARFVIPGPTPGLVVRGNIDINHRPIVKIAGGIATVRSVSFGIERRGRILHVLVPTVVGGGIISDDAAFNHFRRTGQHLGMFDTPQHASGYARRLHEYQEKFYSGRVNG